MIFITNYKIYFVIIILFLTISCGDSPTNNTISSTGNISFLALGSINYNFESNSVKMTEPDISTSYLTIFSNKNESKGSTALVIRILVENQEIKEYDLSIDNSITLSLYNGSTSFKSLNGKLLISEWTNTSFKATFNAILEQIGNPESNISIQNGNIEISTKI